MVDFGVNLNPFLTKCNKFLKAEEWVEGTLEINQH